ncbi:hypothetical protein MY11210_005790 [Beauveria gryllotalpidicola]
MKQKKFIKFGLTRQAFESYASMVEEEVLCYLAPEPSLQYAAVTMDVSKSMAGITILTPERLKKSRKCGSCLLGSPSCTTTWILVSAP